MKIELPQTSKDLRINNRFYFILYSNLSPGTNNIDYKYDASITSDKIEVIWLQPGTYTVTATSDQELTL